MNLAPERVPGRASLPSSFSLVFEFRSAIRWQRYHQTLAAMAEGLSGFTHLFNAMRPMASRDPGPIPAALESP